MDPANWPDPPFIPHLLLENPWPLAIILIALGIALGLSALRNERPRLLIAGGAIALFGIVILVTATLIDTPREIMHRRTKQLVAAALPNAAIPEIKALLTDDMRLTSTDGTVNLTRDQVLTNIQDATQDYNVVSHNVTKIKTESTAPDRGRSYASIFVQVEFTSGTFPARVGIVMEWEKQPDGVWRVDQIPWVKVERNELTNSMLP
ncbi:MAG: hypothetical protein CMJ49_14570 [Planctomycetaceae bacterium]|nr:hypothetical protein [Planctomycetaceae bacterium]